MLFYTGDTSKLLVFFSRAPYNLRTLTLCIILNLRVKATPARTPLPSFVPYVIISIDLLSGHQYKLLF